GADGAPTRSDERMLARRSLPTPPLPRVPGWLRLEKSDCRVAADSCFAAARGSGPAEFFHRPARVPYLRQVRDRPILELHDVDVIRPRALARRRHRTAFAGVRARKHGVGADGVPLLIEPERLHLVASVRDETNERLHPVRVLLHRCDVSERLRLDGEGGIGMA